MGLGGPGGGGGGGGSAESEEGSGANGGSGAALAPPPRTAGQQKTVDLNKQKPTAWLAIELVDMEGKPVPGRKYEVRRSGKVFKSGKLDGKGFARLDGIEPDGNYEVSFLDLDKEAWHPSVSRVKHMIATVMRAGHSIQAAFTHHTHY